MINMRLFFQNFKRLKINIIVSILILTIPAIMTLSQFNSSVDKDYYNGAFTLQVVISLIFCYIGTYQFTFSNFSFITKRNASDVYNSLPISKTSLFLTQAISSFVISITVIFLATTLNEFAYLLAGYNTPIPYIEIFFDSILISLFVSVCALIGISLSSTTITAFVSTVMVAFLPYMLITLFSINIQTVDPSISINTLTYIGVPTSNIAILPLNMFTYAMYPDVILGNEEFIRTARLTLQSAIVTVVTSLIYGAIALQLFKTRQNEISGDSSMSSKNRAFFKIAITLPFLTIIGQLALEQILHGDIYATEIIIILSLFCIALYFIYEFVATKSLKSMIKSAPLFGIMIAFVGITTVSSVLIGEASKRSIPEAEDVASVQIVPNRFSNIYNNGLNSDFYHYELSSRIVFKEPDFIEDVISLLQNENYELYPSSYTVTITTKDGSVQERTLTYTPYQNEHFQGTYSQMSEQPEYINYFLNIPVEDIEMSISPIVGNYQFTDEECLEVYNAIKTDFENGLVATSSDSALFGMSAYFYLDEFPGHKYGSYLPISPDAPTALEKCLEIIGNYENISNLDFNNDKITLTLFDNISPFDDSQLYYDYDLESLSDSEKLKLYLQYDVSLHFRFEPALNTIYLRDTVIDESKNDEVIDIFERVKEVKPTDDWSYIAHVSLDDSDKTIYLLFTEELYQELRNVDFLAQNEE